MSYTDEAVAAGADRLDQKRPGWPAEIGNPNTLDMASPEGCVLGRLYGDYRLGLDVLGIEHGAEYGFNAWGGVSEDDDAAEYAALTDSWAQLITERLTTGQ